MMVLKSDFVKRKSVFAWNKVFLSITDILDVVLEWFAHIPTGIMKQGANDVV